MIAVGSVYKLAGDNKRMRVVHVDQESGLYAFVDIDRVFSVPSTGRVSDFEKLCDSGGVTVLPDPYFVVAREKDLPPQKTTPRERRWALVERYWESRKIDLLNKMTREKVFREIAAAEGIQLMQVRRLFVRFWQRGMTRNAMILDLHKSGGKGKEKKIKRKMGRIRVYGEPGGIIITEEVKKLFEAATEKYWRTNEKLYLKRVYNMIVNEHYSSTINENGNLKRRVAEQSSRPTFRQYYYWFRKNEKYTKDFKAREGTGKFELTRRPLLGNSTIEAPGPGFRYQIDATPADIHLVAESDPNRLIGRPTLYLVVDVFSRMVTGIYVGLEQPSWTGACMALDSMVADKVELCARYGIAIEPGQWPCHHPPEVILADRGEMKGRAPESLVNNLNIVVENTAPYCGDMKGIVERFFRIFNDNCKGMPGAVMKDSGDRGEPDPRLGARLTLSQATRAFLHVSLWHNSHVMEKYPMTTEMIEDGVLPTPLNLWNWGVRHKKGTLRIVDRGKFRLNLLPEGKAGLERGAAVFHHLSYHSPELLDFLDRRKKPKSICVVYDSRNLERIFWRREDDGGFVELKLLERGMQHVGDCLEDVDAYFNKKLQMIGESRESQIQIEIDLEQELRNIKEEAMAKAKEAGAPSRSKRSRVKDIRANRAGEKAENRRKEAFTTTPEAAMPSMGSIQTVASAPRRAAEADDDIYKKGIMEKIRKRMAREGR